jgi:hypothetical protein
MGVFVPVVPPPVPPSPPEEVESEVVVGEDELSSDFAQPRKTKLIIARKISKFVEFFTGTSLNSNVNNQKTQKHRA